MNLKKRRRRKKGSYAADEYKFLLKYEDMKPHEVLEKIEQGKTEGTDKNNNSEIH